VGGGIKWVEERGAPSIGNADEVHAIVLDVTDSKLAEFELQKYREGLEQLS